MPTLLEKIDASAKSLLKLPPGRTPSQELNRYKRFLKIESHRLRMLHRGGESGKNICMGRSVVLDVLINYILEALEAPLTRENPIPREWALVAIGGYGRSELCPQSDVDIMFLHYGELVSGNKPIPYMQTLVDGLLYTLWDLGLKVGHSVRSIPDCVKIANSDMQSKTSLIESRKVKGDRILFEKFQKILVQKCVKGWEDKYITARIEDQAARREKYGNSFALLEPNLKNCSGGLRDYQNLLWMTFFKYQTRTLSDLEKRNLITSSERKLLRSAYDFLLRVRVELHYQVNRPVDNLTKPFQPLVARNLGFTERSLSKRIEVFMGKLYSHLRDVYLITRTLEQRLALLPQPSRFPSFKEVIRSRRSLAGQVKLDGFTITNGEINASTARVIREQPRRLMRLFLHVQSKGLKLHPHLEQMIRGHLSLVNREFLKDIHIQKSFLEILSHPGNVAPVLRLMHETGLLGKYIPEFGKLTCLVQHEYYHRYTADEHTLVCIEKLDRIWDTDTPPFNDYHDMIQDLEKPHLLYLAILLHDSGKALSSDDHTSKSVKQAKKVASRLNLPPFSTSILLKVIQEHLTMIQVSQRRDLDDPEVIQAFASQVQNLQVLNMLTMHTLADSLGTSQDLWNGFKNTLLLTLHHRVSESLSGDSDVLASSDMLEMQLKKEVVRMLPSSFQQDEIDAHFELMPVRYFQIHTAREIASDLVSAHRFMHLSIREDENVLNPVINWRQERDRGFSTVDICTWDRKGLFSKIAGSLSVAGLDILSARIFTRDDGIIFDTFHVADAKTGKLANKKERELFENTLNKSLTVGLEFESLLIKQNKNKRGITHFEEERFATEINFDNEASSDYTVIDVETEDRVGLLFVISDALADHGVSIRLAKISTGKGLATDSFYVEFVEGGKILDETLQVEIRKSLFESIKLLDRK